MVKNKRKRSNKGFSLVELVIIIAIIATLAAAIGIAVLRYIEKGRQAKDLYHASMIKDAIQAYAFPDGFQGRNVEYEDPVTHEKESYKRGWIYVDKEEIRCSDQSTALALIESGLVSVSDDTYQKLRENEEESVRWFPDGPDGDYVCKTDIDEYVFQNSLAEQALLILRDLADIRRTKRQLLLLQRSLVSQMLRLHLSVNSIVEDSI